MNCQQILNTIGLVLGMAGVLVIFFWGPPQPTHETEVGIALEEKTILQDGRTVAQYNQDVEKTKKSYSRMSRLGLILIFIGFSFQLIGTWAQPKVVQSSPNQSVNRTE